MSAEKNWQFELEKNISIKVSLVKLKRVKRGRLQLACRR